MAKQKTKTESSAKSKVSFDWQRLFPWIVFAFSFMLYANTLNHGYVLDDISVITENRHVNKGTEGISTIWKTSYRDGYWREEGTLYRPLTLTIFAIEWQIAPNNSAFAHFINMSVYSILCLVLYILLNVLFQNKKWAFVAALLFSATAIHTEVVANIKSLDEILSLLFGLLAWLFILQWEADKSMKWLLLAFVVFLLGMFTKEGLISMVAIIPISLWFFRKSELKSVFISIMPLALASAVYLLARKAVLGGVSISLKPTTIENPMVKYDFMERFFTSMKLLAMYVQKLFLPSNLAYEYAFNTIEAGSASDLMSILGLLLFIGLIVLAIYGFIKRNFWGFVALGFLASLALYLNLVVMIGAMFAERFAFYASLFWAMALAFLILKISHKQVQLIASVLLVAILSMLTIQRNPVWESNFSLYAADVETLDQSCKAHYNYGLALVQEKAEKTKNQEERKAFLRQAETEFLKALEIKPGYGLPKGQIALVYYRLGDMPESIVRYEELLKETPQDEQAWNNLASAYFTTQQYDQAKRCFAKAVELNPNYADALGNLGAINGMQGNHAKAIEYFKRALAIKPNVAQYYQYISMSYQALGNEAEAQRYDQLLRTLKN